MGPKESTGGFEPLSDGFANRSPAIEV